MTRGSGRRGLGIGRTVEELMDAKTNINLNLTAAKKQPDFAGANRLEDAVRIFVRQIERPSNMEAAITQRIQIAKTLVGVI